MKHTAEIQNTFVAGSDIIVLFQIIPDAAVPFVWMLFINLLNCRCNLLVFEFMAAFGML